jgi:hypothetical protein
MKEGISWEFSGKLTRLTDVSKKDTSGSAERGKTRYFSATGCVVEYPDQRDVFIGGSLIGTFYPDELAMRNILIVTAAQSSGVRLGALPAAFGVGAETVRRVRNRFAEGGIQAIVKDRRGAKKRLSAAAEKRVREYFDQGLTIAEARKRIRNRASSSAIGRIHKQWKDEKEAAKAEAEQKANDAALGDIQQSLFAARPRKRSERKATSTAASRAPASASEAVSAAEEAVDEKPMPRADAASSNFARRGEELGVERSVEREGGKVQHLGVWVMLAMLNALGVYQFIEQLRLTLNNQPSEGGSRRVSSATLRVVVDAVGAAFTLGEQTVEGIRRLATPCLPTLLRHHSGITAAWARRVLHEFADGTGSLLHEALGVALVQQSERLASNQRVVFYVDNHMRPYTGKHTIRKGWRMQDKRVRPGVSDYWVHDEDGRPVVRICSPEHASLTRWLRPIGTWLRDALLDEKVRVLLVFDRAGAFPNEMSQLRDAGFEFVTYERKPYATLPVTDFEQVVELCDERIEFTEFRAKNLGKKRGRIRRIALRMPDGEQVNVIGVSDAPAELLIGSLLTRWSRQENQFKYGVERWGINQLDGRGVEEYAPDAVIPNPARNRLERAIRLSKMREGELLRKLQHVTDDPAKVDAYQRELARVQEQQLVMIATRAQIPRQAPLKETELAGKLVKHRTEYKLLVDTLRVALANGEAELAARLAPLLQNPAEAKKTLRNLFAAPGSIRLSQAAITITLTPAATASENAAFAQLAATLNDLPLTLPGDASRRRLNIRIPS